MNSPMFSTEEDESTITRPMTVKAAAQPRIRKYDVRLEPWPSRNPQARRHTGGWGVVTMQGLLSCPAPWLP
ncbi:hypothetical protein ACFFX0_06180 [Citricoccus parietis]|uniref:Uncharacterized protein n=1 Tax=Citricoccus parietis TaxID=592307 RepID=A0ABV5FWG1_9MICC